MIIYFHTCSQKIYRLIAMEISFSNEDGNKREDEALLLDGLEKVISKDCLVMTFFLRLYSE